jgi:hypothetical protein
MASFFSSSSFSAAPSSCARIEGDASWVGNRGALVRG